MATNVNSACRRTGDAPTRARRLDRSRSATLRALTESCTTTSSLGGGVAGRDSRDGAVGGTARREGCGESREGCGDKGSGVAFCGPRSADRLVTPGRGAGLTGGVALGGAGDGGVSGGAGGAGGRGSRSGRSRPAVIASLRKRSRS